MLLSGGVVAFNRWCLGSSKPPLFGKLRQQARRLVPPAENAGSRVGSAARPFRARLVGCSILWKRRRPRIGNLWWRQKSDPCHAMALDHDVNYHVWML
ncbi:hypothetical protein PI124_g18898 [Phytophthora idaei]|nr:hypothetical protein PI126_g18279 [Phytophthora idaei]KAG3236078.1 hypothetical protein PI124_g18898 [Phytophthora idaei]